MACEEKDCGCGCKILGLAHIGVFVKDIKVSKDFYKNVLGFECYSETDVPTDEGIISIAFIKCGTCEIELVQFPKYEAKAHGPIDHIALSVSDIECMKKCFEEKGIEFETEKPVELPTVLSNGVKYLFFLVLAQRQKLLQRFPNPFYGSLSLSARITSS